MSGSRGAASGMTTSPSQPPGADVVELAPLGLPGMADGAGAPSEQARLVATEDDLDVEAPHLAGAMTVLRHGLRETPELREGLLFTVILAVAGAVGRLLIPLLVQVVVDRGLTGGDHRLHAEVVYPACAAIVAVVVAIYLMQRLAFLRLTRAAEAALFGLRVRAFRHIHRLSVAEQNETRRGTFVARVTADVDILAQFLDWGGINWATSIALMSGCIIAMLLFSWQLALITLLAVSPVVLVLRLMQRGLLRAYDRLRTRIGETLSTVSESVMGAAVVRAYGLDRLMRDRLDTAIQAQYAADVSVVRYSATIFPVADIFGAIATAVAVGAGVAIGPRTGLSLGGMIAFVFIVTLFLGPLSELSDVFDQTQTAIAGWRKILAVLALPVDVKDPEKSRQLPAGALSVAIDGVCFAYRDGVPVLDDVSFEVAPGEHVAIVGQTGSGKTTLAKLLARLADPTHGEIRVGGVRLVDTSGLARADAIRLVPQDGFLFDTTIRANVAMGRPEADDTAVASAFDALGLLGWVESLPHGLATEVGERGDGLSVGERQLVALARAQIGEPGLLVLDEATSAVDPDTERMVAAALERLSRGRTTVTIAHRLSTAESADRIVVMDRGRVVEIGDHNALLAREGTYAVLHHSWVRNTQSS